MESVRQTGKAQNILKNCSDFSLKSFGFVTTFCVTLPPKVALSARVPPPPFPYAFPPTAGLPKQPKPNNWFTKP